VRGHVWLWATFATAAVAYLLFMGPAEVLLPLPVSFALTGPVSAVIGANATLVGAGLVGGLVTFAALLLPGMRAVEGLSKGEVDAPGGGDRRGDGGAPAGAPAAAAA
jgi:hypothetical protein